MNLNKSIIIVIIISFFVFMSLDTAVLAYKPSKIVIQKVSIYINNLPPEFENFTIAQVSDLHRSDVVEKNLIDKTVELTNNLKPDCIVVTGDVANSLTYFVDCLISLNKLSAPYGVFFIQGNREKVLPQKDFLELLSKTNIKPLLDESQIIEKNKSKIVLIGLTDNAGKVPKLASILENIDNSLVKIVLAHNPYIVYNIEHLNKRIDLILSGHTHGGQVVYPIIGAFKAPKYEDKKLVAGLYKFENTQLYINRGIGVSQFNYRINCPPEITLITLKSSLK